MKPPSDPMKNFIFRVTFENHNPGISPLLKSTQFTLNNDGDRSMIAIKVDLPSFDTQLVQKHFLGTEKSFPVIRKYGGDTTLEFYAHTDPHENNFIVYNFFKQFDLATPAHSTFYHKEFLSAFDCIKIYTGDRANGNTTYIYNLYNCIVTKIDQGSLNYEGNEALRYQMTVHYDDWNVAVQDVIENEVEGKGSR